MGTALSLPKDFFQGDPLHIPFEGVTTPGVIQTLFSVTNPDNFNRDLYQVIISCEFSGVVKVYLGDVFIGSARTGPGETQALIQWNPPYPTLAGQTIVVTFEQRPASPVVGIEAYLSFAEIELFS